MATDAARRVKRSRHRGRKAEREWAAFVAGLCGSSRPDIIAWLETWEVKSHQGPPPKSVTGPMEQALRSNTADRIPAVAHKWSVQGGKPYWEVRHLGEDYIGIRLRLEVAEREMAALAVQVARLERKLDAYERAYGGLDG